MMDYLRVIFTHGIVTFRCYLLVILLGAFSSNAYANPELIKEAQTLIDSGKPLAALEMLSPLETDLAGNKDFDYLLGISLLDIGESGQAIFPFQRALAVDPNFAGARMELARAYFNLGELSEAYNEFTTLMTLNPPDSVRQAIEKYIAAIEKQSLKNREGWRGYIQFGIGDDSNANSAPAIDNFQGFDLTDESQETASSIVTTSGGFAYDMPVDRNTSYVFSGNINNRTNNQASFANSVTADAVAAMANRFKSGNSISGSLQVYSTTVDGSFNNNGYMLSGQYGYPVNNYDQVAGFARLGSISYTQVDQLNIKDVSQTLLGVSWVHVFNTDARPSLNLALMLGNDAAVEENSPHGRSYTGLRASSAVNLSHRLNIFGSVGVMNSDYEGDYYSLVDARSDSRSDIAFGVSWRPNKTWTVKPLIQLISNDSNVDIFSYDKTELLITVRSNFYP